MALMTATKLTAICKTIQLTAICKTIQHNRCLGHGVEAEEAAVLGGCLLHN